MAGERGSTDDLRKCPFCAELIKKKAIVCKHCKTDLPENEPLAEHHTAFDASKYTSEGNGYQSRTGVLAIFAILMLAGAGTFWWLNPEWRKSEPIKQEEQRKESARESDQTRENRGEDSQEKASAGPINLRKIKYTVTEVSQSKSISGMQAPAGATYVIVRYTIRNDAQESRRVLTDHFVVTTHDGSVYEPDSSGCTAAGSDILWSQLHPGFQKERVLVFLLPLNALQKQPLMHIGELEGGGCVASIPLVDWRGQILWNIDQDKSVGYPSEPSVDSKLYTQRERSGSEAVFDCPEAAEAWDHSTAGGLAKRIQFHLSDDDVIRVISRSGSSDKVQIVTSKYTPGGKVGWISQGKLIPISNQGSPAEAADRDQPHITEAGTSDEIGFSGRTIGKATNTSDPSDLIFRMLQAESGGNEASIADAQERLEAISKPASGDSAEADRINKLGLKALKEKKFSDAAAYFDSASKADPADPKYLSNLGFAEMNAGELDSAEKDLYASITLAPSRSVAWTDLGLVFAKKGESDKAVAALLLGYRTSKEKSFAFLESLQKEEDSLIRSAGLSALDRLQASSH